MFRLAFLVLCLAGTAAAAPKADPWERWKAHDATSTRTVDHSQWAAFLSVHVVRGADRIARVTYARVATDVDRLARPEQLAFWINLYNALTVDTVLAHFPVASIRDIRISPGLFSSGPWGKKLVRVAGEDLSLDDIEHRIARPLWRDARVHYALNCASLGCPDLAAEPFDGARIDAQLDAAAAAFVNHPRGARFDDAGRLQVSSIYEWFMDDFGANDLAVIAHLKRHAESPLRERLDRARRIDGYAHDWSLNASP